MLDLYTIHCSESFQTALSEMDKRGKQILLVIDSDKKLIGTITDGDLRRAILRKVSPNENVGKVLNPDPICVDERFSGSAVRDLMKSKSIHHVPIIDENGVLMGVHTEDMLVSSTHLGLQAVIMVGGYGRRLGELTKNCPKPMLHLGGKPILQTIIEQLQSAGIHKISLAVNYLASQIKEFFGDGNRFGVAIDYIEEPEPLGTAGALRLMKDVQDEPLLVINGDILTSVNFAHVLRFHNRYSAIATMCVREYKFQVPYGVVNLNGVYIEGLEEKPAATMFINSGVYIVNREALSMIPGNGVFQMTELFDLLREKGFATVAYPIHEYWKDIGSPEDFQEAQNDFNRTFSHVTR